MTRSRLLNALVVGGLAGVTATAYSLFFHSEDRIWSSFWIGIVAFLGAACAGYMVANGASGSFGRAVALVVLGDLFAFLVFMFAALAHGALQQGFSTSPLWHTPSLVPVWQQLANLALFLWFAFAMGNILTRGIGFVMMIPAAILLLATAPDDRA